jgi:hypothetical protein
VGSSVYEEWRLLVGHHATSREVVNSVPDAVTGYFSNYLMLPATHDPKNKQTPWPLVRERTIPIERPPFVDEI